MSVQEYIKADRQWPRHLRIRHAEFRLSSATSRDDITFWKAVLAANRD